MTKSEKFRSVSETAGIEENLKRVSVRGAFYSAAGGVFDFVIRITSTAILARLVIPEHFGLLTLVTAVTAFADQFRDLGLSHATVQREKISHEEVTNLFWVNVGAGTLVAAVIIACSPAISAFYAEPRLTLITIAIATSFVWGGLTVQHESLLSRQMKLGKTTIVRLVASLVSTILAIFLAWKGYGYWALTWREVSRSALIAIGMWLYCPWLPGLPKRSVPVGDLLRFGGNLTASHILSTLVGSVDRILIGKFYGPVPAAMYRQAYQLVVAPMDQLLSPISHVTQPGLSMLQSKPDRYRLFYQKVVAVIGLSTMPLSLFMAVYSREIVHILLGEKWIDATPIFMTLSIGAFIRSTMGTTGSVLITTGRSERFFWVGVINSITVLVFMFIGINWGAIGIAFAQILSSYTLLVPMLHYTFKGTPVTLASFFAALYRPAVASVAMAAALMTLRWFIPPQGAILSLVYGGVLATIVFSSVLVLLPGGLNEIKEHIADLMNAMQKKRAA